MKVFERLSVAAVTLMGVLAGPASAGCDTDPAPCSVSLGEYHIALPEAPQGAPVVLFLHGFGSHGGATIKNMRLVEPLLARGYAVVAPNGIPRTEGRPRSWAFRPGFGQRDEKAFFQEVIASAEGRFGISSERVMLSGFSAGGFMVSYLACSDPDSFAAYAPVSGGFWRPHPESCAGPVRLLHSHGWMDRTVPLEGRELGGGQFRQGDIWAGMEIWREANGCDRMLPDRASNSGPFWHRVWTDCTQGGALEFALFPGGHTLPDGWSDMAADWFETVVPFE